MPFFPSHFSDIMQFKHESPPVEKTIFLLSLKCSSLFSAAFLTQTVCLDDTTVKFEIWDTAGQERYHSLAPMYYRGAQAAIVVYDITNTVSSTSCDGTVAKTVKSYVICLLIRAFQPGLMIA